MFEEKDYLMYIDQLFDVCHSANKDAKELKVTIKNHQIKNILNDVIEKSNMAMKEIEEIRSLIFQGHRTYY